MSGKIERLPQYTERKRGKNIKTNPRHFSRSMRWAMAVLMYALTLSPARSAAVRITSFCPFSTVKLIRSYACLINSFWYAVFFALSLYATVYISPRTYYSINADIAQRAKCTNPKLERCAISYIDRTLRNVLSYSHRQDRHTQGTARRTEVDASRKQERL